MGEQRLKGWRPKGRRQVAGEDEERSCARLVETLELRACLIGKGKVATDDGVQFRGVVGHAWRKGAEIARSSRKDPGQS